MRRPKPYSHARRRRDGRRAHGRAPRLKPGRPQPCRSGLAANWDGIFTAPRSGQAKSQPPQMLAKAGNAHDDLAHAGGAPAQRDFLGGVQTTPSEPRSASCAGLTPIHARTSAVCWPRSGAGRRSAPGVPESRGRTLCTVTLPNSSSGISTRIWRSCTCGSATN
jgi:hypothetical protein